MILLRQWTVVRVYKDAVTSAPELGAKSRSRVQDAATPDVMARTKRKQTEPQLPSAPVHSMSTARAHA
jgi:hypothetical protein